MQLFPTRRQLSGRLLPEVLAVVAIGGIAGSTLRWAAGARIDPAPGAWPWSTLLVNVIGCVAIGWAARRLPRGSLAWDFTVTGALGGFTTMSAFAVELNELVDAGRSGVAVAYLATTVLVGIGATFVAAPRSVERSS